MNLIARLVSLIVFLVPESLRALFSAAIHPEGEERRNLAERAANIDDLTGIPNRRAFNLARSTADLDYDAWVMVFDLDGFKQANDRLGLKRGDDILIAAATSIQLAALHHGSTRVFRFGGDEFVVLCSSRVFSDIGQEAEAEFELLVGDLGVSLTWGAGATFDIADKTMLALKEIKKQRAHLTGEVS